MLIKGAVVKKAKQRLKDAGSAFLTKFISYYDTAVILKSKDPCACWKTGGKVNYVSLVEFSGPHSTEKTAPLLFRIKLNLCPPASLLFHLKSLILRQRLELASDIVLEEFPSLEVTVTPYEAIKLGQWLSNYLDDYYKYECLPPRPPMNLVAYTWRDDGSSKKMNFTSLKEDWPNHTYLWSDKALIEHEKWLNK